jgi:hypothetical protein
LVIAVPSTPPSREHTGSATEDIDAKTGIIGDGKDPGVPNDLARLDQRVARECDLVLHRVGQVERRRPDNALRVHTGQEGRKDGS